MSVHQTPPAASIDWQTMTVETKIAVLKSLSDLHPEQIAEVCGISITNLRAFNWRHKLGVATPARRKPPALPLDERKLRPDAWTPVVPPVADMLANTGCCWPVDGGWCGQKKHKKSYCATHFAMAYVTKPLSEESIDWLSATDDRARNIHRPAVVVAVKTERAFDE